MRKRSNIKTRAALKHRITQADIAADCGCSRTTVATILSGKIADNYAETTRDKVLAAARRLGYVPDRSASNLVRRRTNLVAVFAGRVFDLRTESCIAIINGLLRASAGSGYELVMFTEPQHGPGGLADAVRSRAVDGVIILSDFHLREAGYGELAGMGVPMLVIEATRPGSPGILAIDETGAITEAVGHLAGFGHRRVGFINVRGVFPRRVPAFLESCAKAGVSGIVADVSDWNMNENAKAAMRLLSARQRPTAIITSCDDLGAIAILAALRERGMDAPRDLSLIGWDNLRAGEAAKLTTIDKPFKEKGEMGWREMRRVLENPGYCPQWRSLAARLLIRSSTGPAPRRK